MSKKNDRNGFFSKGRWLFGVSAACVISAIAAPSIAEACGNVVWRKTAPTHKRVAEAAAALDKDDYAQAYKLLDRYRAKSPELEKKLKTTYLTARMRLLQCSLRCSDRIVVSIGREFLNLVERDKENTQLQALLAEALGYGVLEGASETKDIDVALDIFRDLEKRDLMPDSESWAMYAALSQIKNDKDLQGYQQKVERCKKTAVKAESCVLKKSTNPGPALVPPRAVPKSAN